MAFHHFRDMAPRARITSTAQIRSAHASCDESDQHVRDSRTAILRSLELLKAKYFRGFG